MHHCGVSGRFWAKWGPKLEIFFFEFFVFLAELRPVRLIQKVRGTFFSDRLLAILTKSAVPQFLSVQMPVLVAWLA
jgi:hypothetical protein